MERSSQQTFRINVESSRVLIMKEYAIKFSVIEYNSIWWIGIEGDSFAQAEELFFKSYPRDSHEIILIKIIGYF